MVYLYHHVEFLLILSPSGTRCYQSARPGLALRDVSAAGRASFQAWKDRQKTSGNFFVNPQDFLTSELQDLQLWFVAITVI